MGGDERKKEHTSVQGTGVAVISENVLSIATDTAKSDEVCIFI
jgi:hypothetical protein